ncbi:hypothetical protein ACFV2I_36525, partial [Streptomyces microflavus]|uniref:hypothetical protein n=1 Tax=Streptomyces microflavus TaxID=1919 RepID=UPI0036AE3D4A
MAEARRRRQRGERGLGQIVHVHRLAQAVGAARQREIAQALGQLRDPGQGGVAAGAVDQGRPQHRGRIAAWLRCGEQGRFALAQLGRDPALLGIGRAT